MPTLEKSGAQWCARYPARVTTDALAEPFRANVEAFIAELCKGSALVRISTTYRPPERAWLMHYACRVASGSMPSKAVPARLGLDIDWTHGGDELAAVAAAKEMVAAYQIHYPAALESRHIERRAIDMTISWNGALKMRDADGRACTILEGPRDGTNPALVAIGKTFGVIKLKSDPPHWSDDGH